MGFTHAIDSLKGVLITIVTTAGTDEEAFVMLEKLGMPFAHAE